MKAEKRIIADAKRKRGRTKDTIPPCGLCGGVKKRRNKTACCGNWVCGDESEYVMFSHSRDICSRNHSRYTLCSFHHTEKHAGDWGDCRACKRSFDTETYVWYGTNRYNFEKLSDPPHFDPAHCAACGSIISFANGGFTMLPTGEHLCEGCYHGGYTGGATAAPRQQLIPGCIANPDKRRRGDSKERGAVQSAFEKFFRWFDAQIARELHMKGEEYGESIDWAGLEKSYRDWWPDWDMRTVLGNAYYTALGPRDDLGTVDPAVPSVQDFFALFVMSEYPINGYIKPLSDRVTFLRLFIERSGIPLSPEEKHIAEQIMLVPYNFLRVSEVSRHGIRVDNLLMRESVLVRDPALAGVLKGGMLLFGKTIIDEHGQIVFAGNPAVVADEESFVYSAGIALEHYKGSHPTAKDRKEESLADSLHWNGYIIFRNIFDLRTGDEWKHSRFFVGPFAPPSGEAGDRD